MKGFVNKYYLWMIFKAWKSRIAYTFSSWMDLIISCWHNITFHVRLPSSHKIICIEKWCKWGVFIIFNWWECILKIVFQYLKNNIIHKFKKILFFHVGAMLKMREAAVITHFFSNDNVICNYCNVTRTPLVGFFGMIMLLVIISVKQHFFFMFQYWHNT
jgi:hypothetical protein